MEKRWYKISELVEEQILTKVEAVSRALGGMVPVYTPEGKILMPITITATEGERPNNFLLDRVFIGEEIVNGKLYNTYDDIKDCVIRDRDIETYALEEWYFKLEIKNIDDANVVERAKEKLATGKHDALGLPINIDQDLQADAKIPTPKTLGALYGFILALAYEKGINLTESGLQKNLVVIAQERGLPLSKGFVSKTIGDLLNYENARKG